MLKSKNRECFLKPCIHACDLIKSLILFIKYATLTPSFLYKKL